MGLAKCQPTGATTSDRLCEAGPAVDLATSRPQQPASERNGGHTGGWGKAIVSSSISHDRSYYKKKVCGHLRVSPLLDLSCQPALTTALPSLPPLPDHWNDIRGSHRHVPSVHVHQDAGTAGRIYPRDGIWESNGVVDGARVASRNRTRRVLSIGNTEASAELVAISVRVGAVLDPGGSCTNFFRHAFGQGGPPGLQSAENHVISKVSFERPRARHACVCV